MKSTNPDFSSLSYWEDKYEQDPGPFDWYMTYEDLESHLQPFLKEKSSILDIGCGTSYLPFSLSSKGFKHVSGFDQCERLIELLQHEANEMDLPLQFEHIDILNFTNPSRLSFDLIIDKATFDCILCSSSSYSNAKTYLSQIRSLLRNDGTLVCISHSSPEFRSHIFNEDEYNWKLVSTKIGDDQSGYWMYTLTAQGDWTPQIKEEPVVEQSVTLKEDIDENEELDEQLEVPESPKADPTPTDDSPPMEDEMDQPQLNDDLDGLNDEDQHAASPEVEAVEDDAVPTPEDNLDEPEVGGDVNEELKEDELPEEHELSLEPKPNDMEITDDSPEEPPPEEEIDSIPPPDPSEGQENDDLPDLDQEIPEQDTNDMGEDIGDTIEDDQPPPPDEPEMDTPEEEPKEDTPPPTPPADGDEMEIDDNMEGIGEEGGNNEIDNPLESGEDDLPQPEEDDPAPPLPDEGEDEMELELDDNDLMNGDTF
ncbi:putative kinase domain protein [Blattamonas nauphoetae]|uniref:Kinase domain protein n=1 Tax=Blattamonas nauphoetae TaxID=2049346 RepID=A0ABQ9X8Q9_9EUKA|nr:putative kinase domain protein [Blattamonas nauphoetae]